MDSELEAKLEAATETSVPRRYEIIDAETGEPVEGTSFVLAPTGNQMHQLTDESYWVGPAHFGFFYWLKPGCTEDDWAGPPTRGKEVTLQLATEDFMTRKMLPLLEDGHLKRLKEAIEKRMENAKE